MPGRIVTGVQPGRASWLPSELGTSAAVWASAEFQLPCPWGPVHPERISTPIFIATAPAAIPSATGNLRGTCLPQGWEMAQSGGQVQEPSTAPFPSQSIPSMMLSALCFVY